MTATTPALASNSRALHNYANNLLAYLQDPAAASTATINRLYQHWPALRAARNCDSPEALAALLPELGIGNVVSPPGPDGKRHAPLFPPEATPLDAVMKLLGTAPGFCHGDKGPMSDRDIATAILDFDMVSYPDDYVPQEGGVVSRGISSGGYDLTLGETVLVFSHPNRRPSYDPLIDPAAFDAGWLHPLEPATDPRTGWRYVTVPPHTTVLGHSNEIFALPDNVIGQCLGKSTYARCGVDVMVTPLEPGWDGQVTLEFANNTPLSQRYYLHQGILQVCFTRLDAPVVLPYHAKGRSGSGGKYSNQRGVVLPRNSAVA